MHSAADCITVDWTVHSYVFWLIRGSAAMTGAAAASTRGSMNRRNGGAQIPMSYMGVRLTLDRPSTDLNMYYGVFGNLGIERSPPLTLPFQRVLYIQSPLVDIPTSIFHRSKNTTITPISSSWRHFNHEHSQSPCAAPPGGVMLTL